MDIEIGGAVWGVGRSVDAQDGGGEKVTRSRESSAKIKTADFPTSHGRSAQPKPHNAERYEQICIGV